MKRYITRRIPGTFNWQSDEPELIEYAVEIADLWLDRELKNKGRVTADHLNKACGILSEEIFHCILCDCNYPHIRTIPLLNKDHPVNYGKQFDIKIGESTFDVKSISPLPPPSGHHSNLNVNKLEIDKYGACDIYISSKCYPELPDEPRPKKEYRKVSKEWAVEILKKVKQIYFLGWAWADELIKPVNLVQTENPFYSLRPPLPHSMDELAKRFNINVGIER